MDRRRPWSGSWRHGVQHLYGRLVDGDLYDRGADRGPHRPECGIILHAVPRSNAPGLLLSGAMGIYAELRGFVLAHRECGVLRGASKALDGGGVRLAVICPCGARFARSVSPHDPDAERLQEALAAFQA